MLSGIYCIVCKDSNVQEVYVGSTDNLEKRIIKHKSHCNNKNAKKYNYKVYQFIREHGGFDNWKFLWLEMFKTDDNIFLRQLEQNYINTFPEELLLNSQRAFGLDIERRKETKKEYNQKYNQAKTPCPKCFKSMNKSSITPHLKVCPKNTT